MNCDRFHARLNDYLRADLAPEDFEALAAHESACARCHALACERMSAAPQMDASFFDDAAEAEAWLDGVLRRTTRANPLLPETRASDCSAVEEFLAAEWDGADAARALRIDAHLAECPRCRALAAAMRSLPRWCAEFPRLEAGREFTAAVLERTVRTRAPGFFQTLAAMWRRPGLVWEGALVCALLTGPSLGQPVRSAVAAIEGLDLDGSDHRSQDDHWEKLGETLSHPPAARMAGLVSDALVETPIRRMREWAGQACDRVLAPDAPPGTGIEIVRLWFGMLFHRTEEPHPAREEDPLTTSPSENPSGQDSTAPIPGQPASLPEGSRAGGGETPSGEAPPSLPDR